MMTAKRTAKRLGAVGLAIQIVLSTSGPAFAQRRREEPVANPDFKGTQSGPVGEAGPLGVPTDEGPAPGGDAPEAPARPVGGIQIGAASPAKAAPASPLNPLETRVTVRVKGAPLATFLDTISAQSKVNFIITEGLETKQITAFLQNVTVREALQILLEIKGLTYQQIGKSNTFVIAPRSKAAEPVITRIYTLAYVPLIPVGTVDSDQAAITPGSNAGGGGGGSGSSGEISMVSVIQSVLSKGGKIALEPRTNSIIVTDIPESFPQVEQIIVELDKKTPQVMIEAQIVEINSDRARELGFEWGGANGELASFTAGKRDTSFPLNLPRNLGNAHFFDPISNDLSGTGATSNAATAATDATAAGASAAGGATGAPTSGTSLTSAIFDLTSLKVVLRALVSRSEARFLGKPKVLTLNNKPAIIQMQRNSAVATQQQSSSSGGGVGTASVTVERVQTGLVLRVTPQINKEGYITMLVQPTFTDAQEAAISSSAQRIFDPISRGASTLVRVKNGQTLVLGGLLQSTETKVVRKVPFLGYIPLVGWLFTSTSSRRTNTDLVLFITPTIVGD
ncbi:MAG: hypothetical protein HY924_14105 [Elusimicrobia bacterium]|nr:hypothetical protein [Elusimicrobiota bacterium]